MTEPDILSIDTKIKDKFMLDSKKLPQYQKRLEELQKTINLPQRNKDSFLPVRIRKHLLENIEELEEKILNIKSNRDKNFYIAETAQFLEDYRDILKTPIKTSFVGKQQYNNKEKRKIIQNYLDIAKKYYSLDQEEIDNSQKDEKVICNNCPNKKKFDIIDSSIYICQECGAQQEIMLHTSSYKDIDRINISAKYTYDRKVHFRDCMNQYQGKISYKIFITIFYISLIIILFLIICWLVVCMYF